MPVCWSVGRPVCLSEKPTDRLTGRPTDRLGHIEITLTIEGNNKDNDNSNNNNSPFSEFIIKSFKGNFSENSTHLYIFKALLVTYELTARLHNARVRYYAHDVMVAVRAYITIHVFVVEYDRRHQLSSRRRILYQM